MHTRRGFTIVELIVVLVIISILLGLSTLILSNNQANARDSERNGDIDIIARGLETRYKNGNPDITAPAYVTAGAYPGINEMQHILGTSMTGFTPAQISGGYPTSVLPGTSITTFSPPGVSDLSGFKYPCTSSCPAPYTAASLGASLTKNTYYYQPINAAGAICLLGDCVRFQLFWRTEVDNAVHTLESKHQ